MATVIKMPRYGANMEEGMIAAWLVNEGDEVSEGDGIAEIEIEKLTNELLASASGIIKKLLAEQGDVLPCGAPIVIIANETEDISDILASIGTEGQEKDAESSVAPKQESVTEMKPEQKAGADVNITPKALELAEELGVDYFAIKGTGLHGAITRADIRRAATETRVSPLARKMAEEAGLDLRGIQGSGPGGRIVQQDIQQVLTTRAKKPVSVPPSEVKITPKALDLADELGIDYTGIMGTGIHGAITRADIRKAIAEGLTPAAAPGEIARAVSQKLTTLRKTIARRMMESLTTTAQATITMDIDFSRMAELYPGIRMAYRAEGIKFSYTAVIIKAVANALIEFPLLRSSLQGDEIATSESIHIGIGIDTDAGLVVPVIKNAQAKSIKEICLKLGQLSQKAQSGNLSLEEYSGGVFTITNLGMFGIKYFTPVLNPPESGVLGVGALQSVPYIQNGSLAEKHIMSFSLTFDHRIIDGAPAARFLNELNSILSDPDKLFN